MEITDITENDEIVELTEHVKHLQSEIAMLRDHNDEITMKLEKMKIRERDMKNSKYGNNCINKNNIINSELS